MAEHFLDAIKWRGLFNQATHEEALRAHLASPADHMRRAYVGFDPTADSLTIGNLVSIMLLRHLQDAGHAPVVVAGGGTGLIGDPSGKSAERQLLSADQVAANVRSQMRIFSQFLDFSPDRPNRAIIVNNLDWLGKISYLELLRDVGKHFSVNMMIQKDSVRERLTARDQGISYTEFSYMILQAYDYFVLHHRHTQLGIDRPVTLQMGGSDQFGNIVCGIDLIRRHDAAEHPGREARDPDAFGLTSPLVTKSDGGKFGKSEAGAIWLTADRTSPFAYYQFWLNTADIDIPRFLRLFGVLPRDRVDELLAAHAADPGKREAHRALAAHITELTHGPTERQLAEKAAQALFSGDIAGLPLHTLREIFSAAPASQHDKTALAGADGSGLDAIDLLMLTSLVKSKREAREFLTAGAVSINGRPVALDDRIGVDRLLYGQILAVRRGKKNWHVMSFA